MLAVDRTGKGLRTAPRDALISLSRARRTTAAARSACTGRWTPPARCSARWSRSPILRAHRRRLRRGLRGQLLRRRARRPGAGALRARRTTAGERRHAARAGAGRRSGAALGLLRRPKLRRLTVVRAPARPGHGQRRLPLPAAPAPAGPPAQLFPLLPLGTAAVFLLLAVPLGALADRVGRRRLFLAGHGVLLLGYGLLLAPWHGVRGRDRRPASCTAASTPPPTACSRPPRPASCPPGTAGAGLALVRHRPGAGPVRLLARPSARPGACGAAGPRSPSPRSRWPSCAVVSALVLRADERRRNRRGGARMTRTARSGRCSRRRRAARRGRHRVGAARRRPLGHADQQQAGGPTVARRHGLARGRRRAAAGVPQPGLGPAPRRARHRPRRRPRGPAHRLRREVPALLRGRRHRHLPPGRARRACRTPTARSSLDAHLHERHRFPAAGIPTRARVSPSGHLAAWTVFVSGDSYAGTNFSTRTADRRHPHLGSSTTTWRPSASSRTAGPTTPPTSTSGASPSPTTTASTPRWRPAARPTWSGATSPHAPSPPCTRNVECPSLSPDGTRIAYKKRVNGPAPDAPGACTSWTCAPCRRPPLAEPRSVDDQALWPDDRTLVYALPGDYGADLWTVPADGTGTARRLHDLRGRPRLSGVTERRPARPHGPPRGSVNTPVSGRR